MQLRCGSATTTGSLVSFPNFAAAIKSRNETLAIAGDVLSTDSVFKIVYGTEDHPTILSAMDNLLGRLILADFMIMVSDESNFLVADTLRPDLMNAILPFFSELYRKRLQDLMPGMPPLHWDGAHTLPEK